MRIITSPTLAQTIARCQENEALVEIQISNQLISVSRHLDISIQGTRLAVESNQSNLESFSYAELVMDDFTLVTDSKISLCAPEDQCLQIIAEFFLSSSVSYEDFRSQLRPDTVSIMYMGQVWSDTKEPVVYSMWGQSRIILDVGPCEMVCASGEALLEIEAITGFADGYDWQILDDVTGQIIRHCPLLQNSRKCYWESLEYYHERFCLPRAGCYTLLIAGPTASIQTIYFFYESTNVYFDGNHIASFQHLPFMKVPLINGSTASDTTYCDSNSTLVELYFFQREMETDRNRNMSWLLSTADGSALGDLGYGTIASNDHALHYHRECIPKVDSCFRLSISEDNLGVDYSTLGPPTVHATSLGYGDYQADNGANLKNVTFLFVVDGIIHSNYLPGHGYGEEFINGNFDFAQYAGECSSSQLCGNDLDTYFVMQADFLTEPSWDIAVVTLQLMSVSDTDRSDIGYTFPLFFPDQRYRFYSCVHESWFFWNNPDPEYCTEIAVSDIQFFNGNGSYSVSIDGVPFTGTQTTVTGMYGNDLDQVTHVAGQCQVRSSLEGDAISGARKWLIVVCSFATLFAIVGWIAYCGIKISSVPPSPSLPIRWTTAIGIPIFEDQYPIGAWKNSSARPYHCEDTPSTLSNDHAFSENEHEAQA